MLWVVIFILLLYICRLFVLLGEVFSRFIFIAFVREDINSISKSLINNFLDNFIRLSIFNSMSSKWFESLSLISSDDKITKGFFSTTLPLSSWNLSPEPESTSILSSLSVSLNSSLSSLVSALMESSSITSPCNVSNLSFTSFLFILLLFY